MEGVTMSLRPVRGACPEVRVLGDRVKIGETGNEVELKKDEWNVRVELIRTGKRTRL